MKLFFDRRTALTCISICILYLTPFKVFSGGIINKQDFKYEAVKNTMAGTSINLSLKYVDKEYRNSFGANQYKSNNPIVLPEISFFHRNGSWLYLAGVSIPGGGGKVDFPQGEVITLGIGNELLGIVGAPYDGIGQSSIDAESYLLGYRAGIAKQVSDKFSLAGGFHYIDANKELSGNTSITSELPIPDIQTILAFRQKASGTGYFAGLHYSLMNNLSLEVRYESKVKLNYRSKVIQASQDSGNPALDAFPISALASNQVVAGGRVREDLPALLVTNIRFMASELWYGKLEYTRYMEKDANWQTRDKPTDDSYDLGIAIGWQFTPEITLESGVKKANISLQPDQILSLSPDLDALILHIGGKYKLNNQLAISGKLTNIDYDSKTTQSGIKFESATTVFETGLKFLF